MKFWGSALHCTLLSTMTIDIPTLLSVHDTYILFLIKLLSWVFKQTSHETKRNLPQSSTTFSNRDASLFYIYVRARHIVIVTPLLLLFWSRVTRNIIQRREGRITFTGSVSQISMAKEKYARTVLSRKRMASAPYPATRGPQDAGRPLLKKEWEDAICPICMNPPHKAVLLLCSSYEKGCRPYICKTSYRHSNCLDQLKKTSAALDARLLSPGSDDVNQSSPLDLELVSNSGSEAPMSGTISGIGNLDAQHNAGLELNTHVRPQFACPLCRGQVEDWTVIPDSRRYLNKKTRSCAHESCPFSGTYAQLRKHVRRNHPHSRPTEIDPVRQRNWQRLEEESNIGDVLSAIQSTMPGALISGDYVIENDDIYDEFDDSDFSSDEG